MEQHDEFEILRERLREGDEEALAVLCEKYQPMATSIVACCLANSEMRYRMSVSSTVQSCTINVFLNINTIINNAEDIPKYLRKMTWNKLLGRIEKWKAKKRNAVEIRGDEVLESLACDEPTPADMVIADAEYEAIMALLSEDERLLLESRLAGCSWAEIAEIIGMDEEDGEAARKRCERLLERLRNEIS